MWNPPRFPGLSGVASQAGPKGVYHTIEKSDSLFLGHCWEGAPFSPFQPYLWHTPADGGRARPLTLRLEALVKGVEATSGVETTQRCAQHSNPPHQAQGRLGPQPGKKQSNPGVSKGISLWWVFGGFLPNQKATLRSKTKGAFSLQKVKTPPCFSLRETQRGVKTFIMRTFCDTASGWRSKWQSPPHPRRQTQPPT